MDEAQSYKEATVKGLSMLGSSSAVEKSPIQGALSGLSLTLNQLGEEVERLGGRIASARNLTPTEATTLDESRKEHGSALYSEITRMNSQASYILNNLQNIIGEIEL